jgi:hypothetical protein
VPRALFQTEHMDSISEDGERGPAKRAPRRRGVVPTIRAQSDLCRVRDPARVKGVRARVARASMSSGRRFPGVFAGAEAGTRRVDSWPSPGGESGGGEFFDRVEAMLAAGRVR